MNNQDDELEFEFQQSIRIYNNLCKNDDSYHIFHNILYGLYKQALFGNNTSQKPYWFFFHSVRKWNSWMKHFGKSKDDAKIEYIDFINNVIKPK
jgi:acyl-CoA-binding protein